MLAELNKGIRWSIKRGTPKEYPHQKTYKGLEKQIDIFQNVSVALR